MSEYLLAIDCGLRGCGIAEFKDGTLIRAGYVKNTEQEDRGPFAWISMADALSGWLGGVGDSYPFVIEYQRLRIGREKGDPNNIMELQGVAGAISWMFYDCQGAYLPEAWKGTVKKEVMTVRIIERLSFEELGILQAGQSTRTLKLNHNTIDAVGIGLYHLGRLKHERQIHTN